MNWARCKALIASDLYRHNGVITKRGFLYHFWWTPGFRYTTLLRLYQHAREHRGIWVLYRRLLSFLLWHYSIKYGISISADTKVGAGLYVGHFGGIVVNPGAIIGNNCNLSHDVTLGQVNRGSRVGCPTLGDCVYVGPGSKIIGGIDIGDYSAIGANSVVTIDVPAHSVMAGVPARIISDKGSTGYINRTDYPEIP